MCNKITLNNLHQAGPSKPILSPLRYGCVLFMQYAVRMRHIMLSTVACLALPYFSTLSHKQQFI